MELIVVVDDATPEAIGLGVGVELLDHQFLYLGEHLRIALLGEVLHSLVHDLQGDLFLLRLHRAVAHELCDMVAVVGKNLCALCTTTVGGAGFLADLLEIDHRENLSGNVHLHGIVERVGQLLVHPEHVSSRLRCLHLAVERVVDSLVGHLAHALALWVLSLGSRQGTEILADERTDGSLVKVTGDEECPTVGISCALLSHLQDTVVVDVLHVLEQHRSLAPVVVVERSGDRVAKCCLRIELTVLQSYIVLLDEVAVGVGIFFDVGEVEISHLQHRLHILRSRAAADVHVSVAHGQVSIGNLSGESLAQLSVGEVAQPADADDLVEGLQVGKVVLAVDRSTLSALSAECDLIFLEVNLFQHYGDTIGECEYFVVELLAGYLFLDLASLRHGLDDRLVFHIVDVSLNLGGACLVYGIEKLLGRRIDSAVLLVVEVDDDEVGVALADQLREYLVDSLQGDGGHELLHHRVGVVDAGHRLVGEEVAQASLIERRVGTLVLVGVHLVETAEEVALVALVLSRSEAKLSSLAHDEVSSLESIGGLAHIFWRCADVESILGLGKDVVAVASLCTDEGAVGFLGGLGEALGQHAADGLLGIVLDEIGQRLLQAVGEDIMLDHQVDRGSRILFVLVDDDDRLGIVGYGLVDKLGLVGRVLDIAEELLDLCLGAIDVYVTDDDDALVIGMIPFVIVIDQLFTLEVVDDRHQADRVAHTIFRSWIELGQVALKHTAGRRGAQTPLLMDDTTLLVDLTLFKRQAA